jgi:hypothetical protein
MGQSVSCKNDQKGARVAESAVGPERRLTTRSGVRQGRERNQMTTMKEQRTEAEKEKKRKRRDERKEGQPN